MPLQMTAPPPTHTVQPLHNTLLIIHALHVVYPCTGPDKSIEYLSQSDDGTVDAVIGKTTVIAKFVGLIDDLRKVDVPAGVNCNTMTENNCRFASDGFESELTMTCTVTPQSLDIGREKIFTRRNTTETLAHVMVNGKLHLKSDWCFTVSRSVATSAVSVCNYVLM